VIVIDVDNAMLDNVRVQADLRDNLAHEFGAGNRIGSGTSSRRNADGGPI
jgi:hypothetical protein